MSSCFLQKKLVKPINCNRNGQHSFTTFSTKLVFFFAQFRWLHHFTEGDHLMSIERISSETASMWRPSVCSVIQTRTSTVSNSPEYKFGILWKENLRWLHSFQLGHLVAVNHGREGLNSILFCLLLVIDPVQHHIQVLLKKLLWLATVILGVLEVTQVALCVTDATIVLCTLCSFGSSLDGKPMIRSEWKWNKPFLGQWQKIAKYDIKSNLEEVLILYSCLSSFMGNSFSFASSSMCSIISMNLQSKLFIWTCYIALSELRWVARIMLI